MAINLSRLKSYAPKARRDFRKAVEERAARLGITEKAITEAHEQGEVVLIGGVAYSKAVGKQRKDLVGQIRSKGFDQVIEEVGYTWFNRFVAIRFMELHGFLGHAYAVFSNPDPSKPFPQILDGAEHLEFPGLPQGRVREIKAAGDYEEKLYRAILLAQCNALHKAMPFLFEKIGDATELLLPGNLLATDGLVRKLVAASSAEDWTDVEVIGWLYQFYIAEKKDQVFAGLKKNQKITPANIPAATQLFTPHWIVRYLVENSLGRLWMLNRPNSGLAAHMDYYIAPETPEEDFLPISSPEEIKVCDPACGSGHMLTYAFDLLYRIYEDEGYRAREIPELILTKNLHGIEIDDRAGALAAFCLTMKARMKDARFFERSAKPQVCVLQNVTFTPAELQEMTAVVGRDLFTDEMRETLLQFEQAKNFGSLIVPKLRDPAETLRVVEAREFERDLLLDKVRERIVAALRMAEALSPKYHVVVANPPYLGDKYYSDTLKKFAGKNYKESRFNFYSLFIKRNSMLTLSQGLVGMVTLHSWMSGSKYQTLREHIIATAPTVTMAHLGAGGFDSIGGQVVSATAFVLERDRPQSSVGEFINLTNVDGEARMAALVSAAAQEFDPNYCFRVPITVFNEIPGVPFVYWISDSEMEAFQRLRKLGEFADFRQGMATTDNERFLRQWQELPFDMIAFGADSSQDEIARGRDWFPYNKGGGDRRWYGHNEFVVHYEDNGEVLIDLVTRKYPRISDPEFVIKNRSYYFRQSVTYSALSGGAFAARLSERGFIFDTKGSCAFPQNGATHEGIAALLNSCVASQFIKLLAPTLDFSLFALSGVPYPNEVPFNAEETVTRALDVAKSDWDSYETSWDFTTLPLLSLDCRAATLQATYAALRTHWRSMTEEMQQLEEENNRIFIEAYGLQNELAPEVPIGEITLTCNPAYRYRGRKSEAELQNLLRADTVKELLSYAVGCMLGRYSIAEPGLIYANAGNDGFDPKRYGSFPAGDSGIIPVTDKEWFENDAAARFLEFVSQTWGEETLGENLEFIADNLDRKPNESAGDTVRRFLSRSFFKDHLRRYKNRPIYWLFSSGKERAFECLVYLHRYNESTLGRMRMDYVIPLQTKMTNKLQAIEREIASGGLSSAALKARTREQTNLQAQVTELEWFEANLRHMADERIALDLDDGVKVNYGKFGNLLADVKTVTGSKEEA